MNNLNEIYLVGLKNDTGDKIIDTFYQKGIPVNVIGKSFDNNKEYFMDKFSKINKIYEININREKRLPRFLDTDDENKQIVFIIQVKDLVNQPFDKLMTRTNKIIKFIEMTKKINPFYIFVCEPNSSKKDIFLHSPKDFNDHFVYRTFEFYDYLRIFLNKKEVKYNLIKTLEEDVNKEKLIKEIHKSFEEMTPVQIPQNFLENEYIPNYYGMANFKIKTKALKGLALGISLKILLNLLRKRFKF